MPARSTPHGQRVVPLVEVRPLTRDRLPDLAALFATTAMTNRCYCTYFLLSAEEREEVWPAGGARPCFEEYAGSAPAPVGVLAYEDARVVGWCAAAPASTTRP